MKSVGQAVATGAIWMVLLKFAERGIGLVSTVILARLLVPADFGIVAMAMTVFALLEVAGQFGFDQDLIRRKDHDPVRFNTAWTLTVCHGAISALALAILAAPAARFFNEPRLEHVVFVLAFVALVQGFENIGVVLYRKELKFRNDFNFLLAKKVIAFVITVSLAFAFQTYWALVAGIFASRTVGVFLSYWIHPFRPRFGLAATRELFRFSRWIVVNGLLNYARGRAPDLILGRFAGAASLGEFRISSELASLPTSELMFPIMRAAYPGYAKVAGDRESLKQAFLNVPGMVVSIALPAGIGIVLLADPIVRLLLGPKWLAAVPLIQILGIHGALQVFRLTNNAVFNVLGKPYWNTVFIVFELVAVVPLFAALVYSGATLEYATWAYLASSLTVVPVAVLVMSRFLGLTFLDRIRSTWRPVVGSLIMASALWLAMDALASPQDAGGAAISLILLVPMGAVVYVAAVIAMWSLAGKPSGPERRILDMLRHKLNNLKARSAGGMGG